MKICFILEVALFRANTMTDMVTPIVANLLCQHALRCTEKDMEGNFS